MERLAQHLHGRNPDDPLAAELVTWLAASPRFRAFADTYRDKIRKKLRGAADGEAVRDVRAEIQAAHLLLADRRIDLAFESYGSGRIGPDLTVTFRAGHRFNIEVTRLRRVPDETAVGAAVLAKLRQLPPSIPNAVVLAVEGVAADAVDIAAATQVLRTRADAKDEPWFTARGFDGTRGFFERYLRLGAVFAWNEMGEGDGRAAVWVNRSARIAMPEPATRTCLRCLQAS